MKDPAFLFYSKDFYEGTRTMLPKERACLIDLMIYQHQHGVVPNDMERMSMYCSGVDEATLEATLKAKFRLTDEGWVNDKLNAVTEDRQLYKDGQSVNGRIGQFWKKVKAIVTAKELKKLKDVVYNEIGKDAFAKMLTDDKATLEGLLEGLQKHIAIVIEDVNDKETKKDEREFFTDRSLNDVYVKYLKHRKEKKAEATETMISSQIAKLGKYPVHVAIWALNESIENGWTGFFPDNYKETNTGQTAPPTVVKMRTETYNR